MQDTKVYDYMIRSGHVGFDQAGLEVSIPVSIGIEPRIKHGELAAHCVLSAENGGLRIIVLLDNDTGLPLDLTNICLETTISLPEGTPFFCNGYQSWSSSGMTDLTHGIRAPGIVCPEIFRKSGDYSFVEYSMHKAHSWTYTYFESPIGYTLIASLDETTAYTRIDFSRNSDRGRTSVCICKDCEGLIYGPVSRITGVKQEPLKVLDVFMTTGNENDCWDRYFSLFYRLGKSRGLYNRSTPALAWDSSYAMLERLDEIKLTSLVREYSRSCVPLDYFIIGNGYESGFGDWAAPGEDFPAGMHRIAKVISACGFKPGITFSPFVCSSSSALFGERREILLKDSSGRLVSAGRDRSLGGRLYVIDLYNPEGERYIKRCLKTFINEWGMQIIRADMLYAACLNGGRHSGRTRAQAMDHAMKMLRRYTGDTPLIACGAPLGSTFGLVEYCSVTPDLSQNWNGKTDLRCQKALRERESTYNAIRTAVTRRHLDLRAFSSDTGSFTLRKYRADMKSDEQITLFKVCNIFGSLITGSDSLSAYNAESLDRFLDAVSSRPVRRNDRTILGVSVKDGCLHVEYMLHGVRHEESIGLVTSLELDPR